MPQTLDQIFWWLDGNRLSQWGRIESAEDQKAPVPFTANEDRRNKEYPGKSEAMFEITFLDYDAPTFEILAGFQNDTEYGFMRTPNVAAGSPCEIYRVRLMKTGAPMGEGVLALRNFALKASEGGVQHWGKNLYPHTTDITTTANGSTITFAALTSSQSLLVMQQVEAVSGTGDFDAKVVSDPAGTPADAHVFTQVAHTDVADCQFALFNGPITPTDYRYEITGVTGGTWNAQVAAVVIDEL